MHYCRWGSWKKLEYWSSIGLAKIIPQRRPDSWSATVDASKSSTYFFGCGTFQVLGRSFPIEIKCVPAASRESLDSLPSSICFWCYWDGNGNSYGRGGWGSTCLIFEFAGRSRVGVWKVSVYLCNCAPITWQAFPWRAKPCFPKLPRKEKTCFCYKSSRNILNNSRCQVCGWFWIG